MKYMPLNVPSSRTVKSTAPASLRQPAFRRQEKAEHVGQGKRGQARHPNHQEKASARFEHTSDFGQARLLLILHVVDDVGVLIAASNRSVGERHGGDVALLNLHARIKPGQTKIALEERASAAVDVVRVEAIKRNDATVLQHLG